MEGKNNEKAPLPLEKSSLGKNMFENLKENKTFHPYMIRSFKAMQTLCDMRNFKYLMQAQKEGLEIFCKFFFFFS